MTVSLKHTFQSAKTDSADATIVQPSNWNQEHVLTAAAGKVLGRDTSGAGNVQELPISVTPAGDVTIPNNFAVTGTTALTGSLTLTNALTVPNGGTGATTLTANSVLIGNGTSAVTAVAPSTNGNLLTSNGTTWVSSPAPSNNPSIQAIASGSLSDGSTVVVNADGTVSVVAGPTGNAVVFQSSNTSTTSAVYDATAQKVVIAYADVGNGSRGTAVVGTVSGTSISFGTPVIFFNSGTTQSISATYNALAQKIVIAYRDQAVTGFGFAVVGTVSGTSISFGTQAAFTSVSTTNTTITYDSVQQKVVIAYTASATGIAIVGTVSGTSISFGSATTFNAGDTQNIFATYNSAQQKVVIAYRNAASSDFGTAIVGTVSGTSISFGTAVVFKSSSTIGICAAYDITQQKVVIAYRDLILSDFGRAVVGTVSGTSISFGAEATFNAAISDQISATYNANLQKVVIAYRDQGNSLFGTYTFGTVSGTSISFGSEVVFESANTDQISATYDSVQQKVVIGYRDQGNSNFGTSIVVQSDTANLTSENFIGFSNAAYTNGQTATIQIIAAVDDAQSGLTPGQSYFVQTTGSLGLTPSSPSVFAGTAITATKIIVKG